MRQKTKTTTKIKQEGLAASFVEHTALNLGIVKSEPRDGCRHYIKIKFKKNQ